MARFGAGSDKRRREELWGGRVGDVAVTGCAGGCAALVFLAGNNMQSLLRIIDGVLRCVGLKGENHLIV